MAKVSVRKYPLELVARQTLKLEPDAVILPGIYHRGDEHVLYVLGNHKPKSEKLRVRMFVTAQVFNFDPATMHYLGSIHHASECHHFFRVDEASEV